MAAILRGLVVIAIGVLVITVGDALWQSCQSGSWKQLVGQASSSSVANGRHPKRTRGVRRAWPNRVGQNVMIAPR